MSATGHRLRFQLLGPLRVWRDGAELDLGPRQQALLFAHLLAHVGEPVSTTALMNGIWGDDVPASALNIIHKYVGTLRRLLEPELPPRGTGSYLLRRGDAYLFVADRGTLDLARFRDLVTRAREDETRQHHLTALDRYLDALELWLGPVGAGFDQGEVSRPLLAMLENEFFDACMTAADLAVTAGRPERALPHIQRAAAMAPLHEGVHAALITTLAAAGHEAEALVSFGAIRDRLADNLGIDPGPALQAAHQRLVRPTPAAGVRRSRTPGGLVGRVEELAVLRGTVEGALSGGTGLAVVQGEPGVGKTRLILEVTADAEHRGALAVWGHCLHGDGTPAMWPWVEALSTLLGSLSAPARDRWLGGALGGLMAPRGDLLAAPVLPDNGFRFRLFEQVVGVFTEISAQRPILLVLDDLQWADTASMHLFSHLANRLAHGMALIGGVRDRAPTPGPELSRMLATISRVPGHQRVHLENLHPTQVAELVRHDTGRQPTAETVRRIHTRTAGNPFFVLEVARLLTDGAPELKGVPSTVRDVVIDRMAGLDDGSRELLRLAALIGRQVELGLLGRAAGLDLDSCLERLEPVEALGMLEAEPSNPYSLRFTHDLVREAVSATTPPALTARLHLRIADALEHNGQDGESIAERLAHHLWSAGPIADPARTAATLIHAGRLAAGKSALETAESRLRSAAEVARGAGSAELELSALAQLTAVIGMRSMYGFSSPQLLERAERLARRLGLERAATGFLYSQWAAFVQAIELDRSGPLARRLLEQGEASSDPWVRACGLHAWGLQQWDHGNVGEAIRYLRRSRAMIFDLPRREDDPVRHDLQMLMAGMLAEVTSLHGDLEDGLALLGVLEKVAGDDPYMVTVWASIATRIAVIAGDTALALRASARGIAADPGFSFVFLGTYQRLARCWAEALTGQDPAAAAVEAERLITANLLNPPRADVATWHALLAEMRLAGGALDDAATALDQGDVFVETLGERYPHGLLLLVRARLLLARGEPAATVRAAAERARAVAAGQEANLFAQRAEALLAELPEPT